MMRRNRFYEWGNWEMVRMEGRKGKRRAGEM